MDGGGGGGRQVRIGRPKGKLVPSPLDNATRNVRFINCASKAVARRYARPHRYPVMKQTITLQPATTERQ